MLKAGLTGSIAVGKTFVCDVFRELGCHVLDADKTAREVVEPGTKGLAAIVQAFGEQILLGDGSLDRKALGAIIFNDPEKRLLPIDRSSAGFENRIVGCKTLKRPILTALYN